MIAMDVHIGYGYPSTTLLLLDILSDVEPFSVCADTIKYKAVTIKDTPK
jgi:hypothetical protein